MRLKRKQEAEDAKFSDFQNIGDEYLNGGAMAGVGGIPPDMGGMKQGGQQSGGAFDPPPLMGGVDLVGATRNQGGMGVVQGDEARVVMRNQNTGGPQQNDDDNWGAGGGTAEGW